MLELFVPLERGSKVPLYQQLYTYLKNEIYNGSVSANTRLPSVRWLARSLDVSLNTVKAAYQQLADEGYIVSREKSGYFVQDLGDGMLMNSNTKPNHNSIISKTESNAPNQYLYDFYNLKIDLESFPFQIWRKYHNVVFQHNQPDILMYGDVKGDLQLRREISLYLHQSRGVQSTEEQIVVGAGTQQLIHVLCLLFGFDGRKVGFEEPGYHEVRHVFMNHGYHVSPVAVEEDGLDLEELAQSKARILYTTPSHQFPTGAIMPIIKRLRLLQWAERVDGYILEDDYDGEFRYIGNPIPSLQGLDQHGRVVYLGTFSKTLLPGIRVSFMVLPKTLLTIYNKMFTTAIADQTSSFIHQRVLTMFMKSGEWYRHIRRMRTLYARKHRRLIESITQFMGNHVRIAGHGAGTHILIEVYTVRSAEELSLLAELSGVKVQSIDQAYMIPREKKFPHFLIGFGGIPFDDISNGIERLSSAWFDHGEINRNSNNGFETGTNTNRGCLL